MTKSEIASHLGLNVEQLDGAIVALARDKTLRGQFDTAINRSYASNKLVDEDLNPPEPHGTTKKGKPIWENIPTWIFPDQVPEEHQDG